MASLPRFEKYEGLGNDFVVVDATSEEDVSIEAARALCDRRRGVGADGILVILPPRAKAEGATARMRVINADGSIPEMCGNGLRCAALHLARAGGVTHAELAIETDSGILACAVERNGDDAVVFCDMGVVRVLGDVTVEIAGERVLLTRADAGNPHAVALGDYTRADFERLGQALSIAPEFADARGGGVNVELARMVDGVLDVLVWERGAGATLACGTGACAVVAVARAKGMTSAEGTVRVRLPGGELEVGYDRATGRTSMRGPARRVFAGSVPGGQA